MHVSRSCYAITGLAYLPPWSVNSGFVTGDDITLILDTGANATAAATIHGYASAPRPSNGLRVMNLEKHFDHIGGNSFFRDRGVEIWGHAGINRAEDEFRAEMSDFNEQIPNRARWERQESSVFYRDTRLVNPDHSITANTHLDLGNLAVQILLTPGHTPTNISAWVPDDRVLFCGDCLVHGYLPNLDTGGPPEWNTWLNSLVRIEALKPLAIVPGHGPVAQGDQVAELINTVRHILEESIARGYSPTTSRPQKTQ